MKLLLDTLLKLEPTLVVQFYIYMLVSFGLGIVVSAFVVNKFHERDAERYQDGIANHNRLKGELKEAEAKIAVLQAEIQDLNHMLRQSRTFPPKNPNASNPADNALFDALSRQNS